MFAAQVSQMRPFFLVRQVRANPIGHHYNESSVIHIQPVGTTDKLVVAVSDEWTIDIFA
jgi:hypothetical protein